MESHKIIYVGTLSQSAHQLQSGESVYDLPLVVPTDVLDYGPGQGYVEAAEATKPN